MKGFNGLSLHSSDMHESPPVDGTSIDGVHIPASYMFLTVIATGYAGV